MIWSSLRLLDFIDSSVDQDGVDRREETVEIPGGSFLERHSPERHANLNTQILACVLKGDVLGWTKSVDC